MYFTIGQPFIPAEMVPSFALLIIVSPYLFVLAKLRFFEA